MKRAHLIISGNVHGVFFRRNTKKLADSLGLKGWVKNTNDGKVEVVAEGSDESIKKLAEFCKIGPAFSRVDDVKASYSNTKNEFKDFCIRS